MVKTNYFKVLSKEDLQALASKYALEVKVQKNTYSLYSSQTFEGNTEELSQELQKLLPKGSLLFLHVKTEVDDLFIAITPDRITTKPSDGVVTAFLIDNWFYNKVI